MVIFDWRENNGNERSVLDARRLSQYLICDQISQKRNPARGGVSLRTLAGTVLACAATVWSILRTRRLGFESSVQGLNPGPDSATVVRCFFSVFPAASPRKVPLWHPSASTPASCRPGRFRLAGRHRRLLQPGPMSRYFRTPCYVPADPVDQTDSQQYRSPVNAPLPSRVP